MTPPEPFTWEQRDACTLRCEACGAVVDLSAVDLHSCETVEQTATVAGGPSR